MSDQLRISGNFNTGNYNPVDGVGQPPADRGGIPENDLPLEDLEKDVAKVSDHARETAKGSRFGRFLGKLAGVLLIGAGLATALAATVVTGGFSFAAAAALTGAVGSASTTVGIGATIGSFISGAVSVLSGCGIVAASSPAPDSLRLHQPERPRDRPFLPERPPLDEGQKRVLNNTVFGAADHDEDTKALDIFIAPLRTATKYNPQALNTSRFTEFVNAVFNAGDDDEIAATQANARKVRQSIERYFQLNGNNKQLNEFYKHPDYMTKLAQHVQSCMDGEDEGVTSRLKLFAAALDENLMDKLPGEDADNPVINHMVVINEEEREDSPQDIYNRLKQDYEAEEFTLVTDDPQHTRGLIRDIKAFREVDPNLLLDGKNDFDVSATHNLFRFLTANEPAGPYGDDLGNVIDQFVAKIEVSNKISAPNVLMINLAMEEAIPATKDTYGDNVLNKLEKNFDKVMDYLDAKITELGRLRKNGNASEADLNKYRRFISFRAAINPPNFRDIVNRMKPEDMVQA